MVWSGPARTVLQLPALLWAARMQGQVTQNPVLTSQVFSAAGTKPGDPKLLELWAALSWTKHLHPGYTGAARP